MASLWYHQWPEYSGQKTALSKPSSDFRTNPQANQHSHWGWSSWTSTAFHLEFCNSLFIFTPNSLVPPQSSLHRAARVIFQNSESEHATPPLNSSTVFPFTFRTKPTTFPWLPLTSPNSSFSVLHLMFRPSFCSLNTPESLPPQGFYTLRSFQLNSFP